VEMKSIAMRPFPAEAGVIVLTADSSFSQAVRSDNTHPSPLIFWWNLLSVHGAVDITFSNEIVRAFVLGVCTSAKHIRHIASSEEGNEISLLGVHRSKCRVSITGAGSPSLVPGLHHC
jgi:hypothetical protein